MAKITFNIYWEDSNNDNSTITDKIDSLEWVLSIDLDILNRTWEIIYDVNLITSDEIINYFSEEWFSIQLVTNED